MLLPTFVLLASMAGYGRWQIQENAPLAIAFGDSGIRAEIMARKA